MLTPFLILFGTEVKEGGSLSTVSSPEEEVLSYSVNTWHSYLHRGRGLFVKDTEYLLIQPALVPLAQVRDGDPVLGHGDPGVGGVQGSLVLQPDPVRAQLQPRVHQHLLNGDGVTLCPWRRHSWDFLTSFPLARSS